MQNNGVCHRKNCPFKPCASKNKGDKNKSTDDDAFHLSDDNGDEEAIHMLVSANLTADALSRHDEFTDVNAQGTILGDDFTFTLPATTPNLDAASSAGTGSMPDLGSASETDSSMPDLEEQEHWDAESLDDIVEMTKAHEQYVYRIADQRQEDLRRWVVNAPRLYTKQSMQLGQTRSIFDIGFRSDKAL